MNECLRLYDVRRLSVDCVSGSDEALRRQVRSEIHRHHVTTERCSSSPVAARRRVLTSLVLMQVHLGGCRRDAQQLPTAVGQRQ